MCSQTLMRGLSTTATDKGSFSIRTKCPNRISNTTVLVSISGLTSLPSVTRDLAMKLAASSRSIERSLRTSRPSRPRLSKPEMTWRKPWGSLKDLGSLILSWKRSSLSTRIGRTSLLINHSHGLRNMIREKHRIVGLSDVWYNRTRSKG